MPVYHITDPKTGQSIDLRGDGGPPTEAELEQIFANLALTRPSLDPSRPPSTRGPHGYPTDERGQEYDPKTGAAYQPGMFQRGVDYVSDVLTHPTPGMQLAGDVAAVLSGALGSRGAPSRLPETPTAVGEALSESAPAQYTRQIAKGVVKKVTGLDPDAMAKQTAINELQATRMRLQAAKVRTRQMQASTPAAAPTQAPPTTPIAENVNAAGRAIEPTPTDQRTVIPDADAAQMQAIQEGLEAAKRLDRPGTRATPQELDAARKATASVSSPPETVAEAPSPSLARARGTTLSPSRAEGAQLRALIEAGGLNETEARAALQMIRQGKDPLEIQRRLMTARQLSASGPFAKLPTDAELESQLAYEAKNPKAAE